MIAQEEQNELRRRYNPDGSQLRMHQLNLMEILKYIDNVCRKNDITYWLSSGTCLGSIRHGGFIPWDDDIDIEMMRKDYLKFVEVFKETDEYVLQTHNNDKFYPTPFAKVRKKNTKIYDSLYKYKGQFVDVFCLEYSSKCVYKFCNLYWITFARLLYERIKKDPKGFTNLFLFIPLFQILKSSFYLLIVPFSRTVDRLMPRKKLRHTYGCGWIDNIRSEGEILPTTYSFFEGFKFPVPGNYHLYLRRIFGDYMTIPKETDIPVPHVQYFQN